MQRFFESQVQFLLWCGKNKSVGLCPTTYIWHRFHNICRSDSWSDKKAQRLTRNRRLLKGGVLWWGLWGGTLNPQGQQLHCKSLPRWPSEISSGSEINRAPPCQTTASLLEWRIPLSRRRKRQALNTSAQSHPCSPTPAATDPQTTTSPPALSSLPLRGPTA